jgi:transcriptional regulator with PAS, ATPase and Fis domain
VGESAALRATLQRARVLSDSDLPVLLLGETGVGKEVFARAIHENGSRANGPFVAVNCGGLPRELLASELFGYVDGAFTGARRNGATGKLHAADGGTLFLDEISEMPLELQPYLLRVLEDGEVYPLGATRSRHVNFRLIAASNREIVHEIETLRFRMDLYYRISATTLQIPPLRERIEDLPDLVAYLAEDLARRKGCTARRFTPEAIAALARHAWPGNIRELRNVVDSMVLVSGADDEVGVDALPQDFGSGLRPGSDRPSAPPSSGALEDVEREAIARAIRDHAGNLTRVANALRVSRSTLYLKIRKYRLESLLAEIRWYARP